MWTFGEHVVNFWRLRRGGIKGGVFAPRQVQLRDTQGQPTGVVAELDAERTFAEMPANRLDMLRAEPIIGRPPTQRELDDLFDTQREASRQPAGQIGGLIRGTHEDSGVLSAHAPVERERF